MTPDTLETSETTQEPQTPLKPTQSMSSSSAAPPKKKRKVSQERLMVVMMLAFFIGVALVMITPEDSPARIATMIIYPIAVYYILMRYCM